MLHNMYASFHINIEQHAVRTRPVVLGLDGVRGIVEGGLVRSRTVCENLGGAEPVLWRQDLLINLPRCNLVVVQRGSIRCRRLLYRR